MTTDKKVDFFIVGEPKSGTTALASFLNQHPKIGISYPKEPHFFATDLIEASDKFHDGKARHFEIRTIEEYMDCFREVANKPIWGEGSTHYLESVEAAKNIKNYNPESKIIIMLRNPVDFVYSLHNQYVNNGVEDEPDFKTALAKENDRRRGMDIPKGVRVPMDLFYSDRVKYAEQIQRFYDQFPKNQILILINEEFRSDNAKGYNQVLKFLGAPEFSARFGQVHDTKTPRSKLAHKVLNNIAIKNVVRELVGPHRYNKVKNALASVVLKHQSKAPIDDELRHNLYEQYKTAISDTAKLINRPDLTLIWGESTNSRGSHAKS
jgi:hypothetical protein